MKTGKNTQSNNNENPKKNHKIKNSHLEKLSTHARTFNNDSVNTLILELDAFIQWCQNSKFKVAFTRLGGSQWFFRFETISSDCWVSSWLQPTKKTGFLTVATWFFCMGNEILNSSCLKLLHCDSMKRLVPNIFNRLFKEVWCHDTWKGSRKGAD
jgi:hypothetical protein